MSSDSHLFKQIINCKKVGEVKGKDAVNKQVGGRVRKIFLRQWHLN